MSTQYPIMLKDAVVELSNLMSLDLVAKKDEDFCKSLIDTYTKYKKLSEKQEHWLFKMLERALFGDFKGQKEEVKTEDIGHYKSIVDMFTIAKENIKYPKITVKTKEGEKVQLSMSGVNAQQPKTINITDGGPYGDNKWYGRILTDGTWQKSGFRLKGLLELLHELSVNSHGIAQDHGHNTSTCCFCSKKLSQDNSVKVGYGEVCAKNFGLHLKWKNAVN